MCLQLMLVMQLLQVKKERHTWQKNNNTIFFGYSSNSSRTPSYNLNSSILAMYSSGTPSYYQNSSTMSMHTSSFCITQKGIFLIDGVLGLVTFLFIYDACIIHIYEEKSSNVYIVTCKQTYTSVQRHIYCNSYTLQVYKHAYIYLCSEYECL